MHFKNDHHSLAWIPYYFIVCKISFTDFMCLPAVLWKQNYIILYYDINEAVS